MVQDRGLEKNYFPNNAMTHSPVNAQFSKGYGYTTHAI